MYSSSKHLPMQHENIPVNTTEVKYARPINGNTTSLSVGRPNKAMIWGVRGSNAVVKLRNIPEKIILSAKIIFINAKDNLTTSILKIEN